MFLRLSLAVWLAGALPMILRAQAPEAQPAATALPRALPSDELHHLYQLSERIYSGSQPEGDAGFAALRKLGVKTILSVDGAKTDVELARKYGMRYVHQPIGYEGISGERAVEIAKAAGTLPGPVYVHCHHGKHRGPAAAAVCAIALAGWTPQQATAWMKQAGTSPNYAGLYRSVGQFRRPTAAQYEAAPNDFPAQVEPASFVESMVAISLAYDHLKLLAANDYRPLATAPDLTAAHEALQLQEQYRELMRTDEYAQSDDDLQALMQQAEQHSASLHKTLLRLEKERPVGNSELRKAADQALHLVGENCKSCHATFRDERSVE